MSFDRGEFLEGGGISFCCRAGGVDNAGAEIVNCDLCDPIGVLGTARVEGEGGGVVVGEGTAEDGGDILEGGSTTPGICFSHPTANAHERNSFFVVKKI